MVIKDLGSKTKCLSYDFQEAASSMNFDEVQRLNNEIQKYIEDEGLESSQSLFQKTIERFHLFIVLFSFVRMRKNGGLLEHIDFVR